MYISERKYEEMDDEAPQPTRDLLKRFSRCSDEEMIDIMNEEIKKPWNGLRPNLFHYVPILNRLDAIFAKQVKKYSLDSQNIRLIEVEPQDVKITCTCLKYTYSLLEYSSSKNVYSSSERIFALMLSTSIDVSLDALNLVCLLKERLFMAEGIKSDIPNEKKHCLLDLALSFPPPVVSEDIRSLSTCSADSTHHNHKAHSHTTKTVGLYECQKSDFVVPSSWRCLNFEYYNMLPKNQSDKVTKSPVKREKLQAEIKREGLRRFHLSAESLQRMSYQQIYDLAKDVIPEDRWSDFCSAVRNAKAYCNDSKECLQLRRKLVTFKCVSVAASILYLFYFSLTSILFDKEPNLLKNMSALIDPIHKDVSYEASFATMRAFVALSERKAGGSDLLRAWGGNMNRSLLFDILRDILKDAGTDSLQMDPRYLNYFCNLLANFIDNKKLVPHLRNAGLMKNLTKFLTFRTNYRMTRSGPLHLIQIFIDDCPEVLDDFIADDGFQILIDLLKYEVDFSISNSSFGGGAPQNYNLSYSITVRQVRTIDFLLKLIFDMITKHSGDRMRNLYDSPILNSFIKILDNSSIFGYTLLTGILRIISGIINSEPTAYSILDEAGVVDGFFRDFDSLFGKSDQLLIEIPEVISAVALNRNGQKKIIDSHLIQRFFTIFHKQSLCYELLDEDGVSMIAEEIDELSRHYPEFKPIVDDCILELLQEAPKLTHFSPMEFYQSPLGSIYMSKNEKVIEKEEGSSKLRTWDSSKEGVILDCASGFICTLFGNSKTCKEMFGKITAHMLLDFVMVDNAPFDYVLSNSLYSIGSVIKEIYQVDSGCFSLKEIMSAFKSVFKELHSFIHRDSYDCSYFDQFINKDPKEGGKVLSDIGKINCLLYILSDVYGSVNKMDPNKRLEYAKQFASPDGLNLIKELLAFYSSIAFEESLYHYRTPQDAAKNVLSVNQGITRYHVEIGHPNEQAVSWDGTSAKFKNLSMLFFHFSRCQSWMRYIFASLIQLSMSQRPNGLGLLPKYTVQILICYANTTFDLLSHTSVGNQTIECGYTLLLLNQLYSTLFTRSRSTDRISSPLVICLLQNGTVTLLRNLALKFFALLSTFPSKKVQEYASSKYVEIDPCSTTNMILNQVLTIFSAIGSKDMLSEVSWGSAFYPGITDNYSPYFGELSYSILVQTSIASFGLLNEIFHKDSHQMQNCEIYPISIIEKLISISKNFYNSVSTNQSQRFQGKLYPLSVEATMPSDRKVDYLVSMGLSHEDSIKSVVFCRDSINSLLEVEPDDAIEISENLTQDKWESLLEKMKETPFKDITPISVDPQYMEASTLDDLNFSRGANETSFLQYWLQIAQLYEKATPKIASLLLSLCSKSSYFYFSDVAQTIWSLTLKLFDEFNKDESIDPRLSNMLILFASLEDNASIKKYENINNTVAYDLIEKICSSNPSYKWFTSALKTLEKFILYSKIPGSPEPQKLQMNYDSDFVARLSLSKLWKVGDVQQNQLYERLLQLDSIDNCEAACAVARVLLLLTDSNDKRMKLCRSSSLKTLIKCLKLNERSEKLEILLNNLIQRCYEDDDTIAAYMDIQVGKIVRCKDKDKKKRMLLSLSSIIGRDSWLAFRNSKQFVNSISEKIILAGCEDPLKRMDIVPLSTSERAQLESAGKLHPIATNEVAKTPINTGLMGALLSDYMSLCKEDMISSPPADETIKDGNGDNNNTKEKGHPITKIYDHSRGFYSSDEILRNKHIGYGLFLLQCIAESLFSYKQAKTEFLMFSKKPVLSNGTLKPKTTSLNFLVHKLANCNPFVADPGSEEKRKKLLSQYAAACILALVSTVPIKGVDAGNIKFLDPDMTFVRKFTVDILIKALKGSLHSQANSLAKYSRVVNIINVFSILLGDQFDIHFSLGSDKLTMANDYFLNASIMLKKKVPALLTSILSQIDVNFPYTLDVSNSIMKCLSLLGQIKVKYQNEFRKGQQHAERDEEVLSGDDMAGQEQAPDLLRNSTLGMYDVDEIEDEDDEFSDDILGDQDIEIVYSSDADDNMDNDENMSSTEGSSVSDESSTDNSEDDARYIDDDDDVMIQIVDDDPSEMSATSSESDIIISDGDLDEFEDASSESDIVDEESIDSVDDTADDDAILDQWADEHASDEEISRDELLREPLQNDLRFHSANGINAMFIPDHTPDIHIPLPAPAHSSHLTRRAFPLVDFTRPVVGSHSHGPLMTLNFGAPLGITNGTLADILRTLDFRDPKGSPKMLPSLNTFIQCPIDRWMQAASIFFQDDKQIDCDRIIPSILNLVYDRSMYIEGKKREERERLWNVRKLNEEKKRKEREALEKKKKEDEQAQAINREPVYVTIDGVDIDIAGTDIDPEFLQALPDDMKEEVFVQHVCQRITEAHATGTHVREMEESFLSSLPELLGDQIRNATEDQMDEERVLEESRLADNSDSDISVDDSTAAAIDDAEDGPETTKKSKIQKNSRIFFPPMVDRYGIASILKMVFVPQDYDQREAFFKAISYICYSKRTRIEFVTMLLYVLEHCFDGSLEQLYYHICQRAKLSSDDVEQVQSKASKTSGDMLGARFPISCTSQVVASQALDVIQFLLENESYMRLYFIVEQEQPMVMKKIAKKRNLSDTSYRYPINVLLDLLGNSSIVNGSNLIDVLSRSIQIATLPLRTIKKKVNSSKVPLLPVIPDQNLKPVVGILVSDNCASKVFQQTIASIQNLSLVENAKVVFPHELSSEARILSSQICDELNQLIAEIQKNNCEIGSLKSLSRFYSSSSNQAKLLRVLTALDYLFRTDDKEDSGNDELKQLYQSSALGPLWEALSECLELLSERTYLSQVTTVLSPLIEALMVVCKHSKVEDLPPQDIIQYEKKKTHDFTNEPIESLFFAFTEEHKKILNQMIRNNPKLMSGPFSILVRNPKVLEFDNKRVYFQHKLHEDRKQVSKLSVTVSREQVFLDSYRALFFKPVDAVRTSVLEIHFKDEEGVDAGGLTREWYQVLSRQMFNPGYALFTPVTSDKTTFHPNRASWVNPEHLSFFKFVGMIIGKAIYDGYMLDCHFTRAVFKSILGKPVSLKDMESLDPDYYKSLVWMLKNNITGIISETFSVEADDYGEHKIIDLKDNGRNIPVTEENKQEYVRLLVDYRLLTSVKDQMDNFLKGFYEIVPKKLISIFDERELELLISGLPDIDVDDWKANATYVNYSSASAQIQWFWRAVKSFDEEERAKLLQFVTGTSKVPLNGFKELSGVNGISKFSIHRVYCDTNRLPTAHTCFNQLDLPEYESYGKLRAALLLAVKEGHEGFGFV